MGLWAILLMSVVPTVKALRRLFGEAPRQGLSRTRAVGVVGGLAALAAAALFLVPFPHATVAMGVAIVPERGSVRAGAEGFVTDVVASPDAPVAAGTALIRLADPIVDAEVKALKARLAALKARLASLELGLGSAVEASVTREDIKSATEALDQETLRKAEQTILAPTDGVFRLPRATDIAGRFVQRGEAIGFVQDPQRLLVSVVVDQVGLGDIRHNLRRVALWPEGVDTTPADARVALMHPGGVTTLPSAALAVEGGGDVPIDPRRPGELRTLSNVFRIDIEPLDPQRPGSILIGRHYLVRFQHDPEPIGLQLFRAGRRLLLDRFGV